MIANPKTTSVILAGGVARGAFEAGALEVLSAADVRVSHIVAASSGALNGAMYAAAIRAGREREAARRLASVWREQGHWTRAFSFSLSNVLRARGLSTTANLVCLMRREIETLSQGESLHPISLSLVLAAVDGDAVEIGQRPATTFEKILQFDESAFDTCASRELLYSAAAASAAFPILFAPVRVDGIGLCLDGGLVNNSPVGLAIDQGAERVILIAPSPAVAAKSRSASGLRLVAQLAEMLVGERLYRDLRQAEQINDALAKLDALAEENYLSSEQLRSIKHIFGLQRHMDLICIRPDRELPGSAFGGFFCRSLRSEHVEAGREAATAALLRHGLGWPSTRREARTLPPTVRSA